MARILILGRAGQVATALQVRLPNDEHVVEALGRPDLNLADPIAVCAAILERSPDIVINASGSTLAAWAAAEVGTTFIHFSTDYVFDGSKGQPYIEDDATQPPGVCGRTKLEGEAAIAAANPRHVILRTAWVCSQTGAKFLKTMLRLAAGRDEPSVVDDQCGRPTVAKDLADAVAAIVRTVRIDPPADTWSVFHAASQGETAWRAFARAIMEGSAARGGPACFIKAIATADFPNAARRPADSRPATGRLQAVYGIRQPVWRDALDACLRSTAP